MLRDKSYSWGWSLLHSSSPSTGSLRVGFMPLGNETKGCSSGTSSPLWSLDRAKVISSNKLENVKKIQMVCFKTDFF